MSKVQTRQIKILSLLSATPISTNAQLAEALQVSLETIRKDLKAMSDQGLVLLVHGGVALCDTHHNGPAYHVRESLHAVEKSSIGKAASKLIAPGDSLILESSTTTVELTKALLAMSELLSTLVIVTNSFRIASLLSSEAQCRRLFFLGGWVNPTEQLSSGLCTTKALTDFHVDKAFLSGAALSDSLMLTGFYDDDISFQKAAMAAAKETVLMIDSSKFYTASVLQVTHVSALHYLVTDKQFTGEEKERILATGVRIVSV